MFLGVEVFVLALQLYADVVHLDQGCQTQFLEELKTTWFVCWSRVGTKLCRAAALQELSLTPLT